jgi:pimeloyl-ACP methyl ester carboxylesterase
VKPYAHGRGVMGAAFAPQSIAIVVAILVGIAGSTNAAEQTVTIANMRVSVWAPDNNPHGALPVIIFSHGFHGCATQTRFLMESFASNGYLVFAPNHRDAACGNGGGSWMGRPELPFREPRSWDETTYRDRADDIRALAAALATDDRFRNRADLTHLGLAGHSLGGYTVLGLGGAWPSWKLAGVKAILALSPYAQPFIDRATLSGLSAPVMFQGGTRDFGITPSIARPGGAYDLSPEPKYLVEFDKASHFAWTNLGRSGREEIVAYSVAFMNHYVKGRPADPILTASTARDVTLYQHAP